MNQNMHVYTAQKSNRNNKAIALVWRLGEVAREIKKHILFLKGNSIPESIICLWEKKWW